MPMLNVPTRLEQLQTVNDFLQKNTPKAFVNVLPSLQLAAEELLVNVFSYAYPEGTTGKAEIALSEVFFDGEPLLCFSITDWGKPFNPFSEAPVPDVTLDTEQRPIGGLGIYLIKQITAHQSYTFENKANRINVFFSLPADHETEN